MPTIEPYAISGCMTTAGKINLNDQIAPFTWLHRNTALHARILADAGFRRGAVDTGYLQQLLAASAPKPARSATG